jgi:bacterioferritin-associated ferredoxin
MVVCFCKNITTTNMLAALLQGELKEFLRLTEGLRCCGTCEFAALDVTSARELLNKHMGADMIDHTWRKA